MKPPIITLILSILLFLGAWKNDRRVLFLIQLCIIFSLFTTGWYNIQHNPHLLFWLCNITAILALTLTIKHYQKLFDIFFYFAWTGDLLTLFIWPNPVSPPLETYPWSWAGFILKHTAPLAFSIFCIKQGNLLSNDASRTALKAMVSYTGIIIIYNLVFNQNLLDLREPTLDIERLFGKWPFYVLVNVLLALLWYYMIHIITKRIKIIKNEYIKS